MGAHIVLASGSPRRRELVAAVGLSSTVIPSTVDEAAVVRSLGPSVDPGCLTEALAQAKADDVAARLRLGAQALPAREPGVPVLVVAADTVVLLDNQLLGKPRNVADAVIMLSRLSGRTHSVVTGVAVVPVSPDSGPAEQALKGCRGHEISRVTFRHLSAEQIDRYVASGEPMDKAGAYGIQGLGALLVKRIEGDFYNIVGLPLVLLAEMLARFGVQLP